VTDGADLWIGIDGGGTGCRARLVDATGRRLAEGTGDVANLTLGVERAAESVVQAARDALQKAGLAESLVAALRAGIGIAGAESGGHGADRLASRFASLLPFRSVTVRNDAWAACLGAHDGDGAILILGTGSHGLAVRRGEARRVGGWGFLLSDSGSGAVLGQRAARRALLAHEGIASGSDFTRRVMARFDGRPDIMLQWALKAIPRDWATLAPSVFDAAEQGDPIASPLLAEAVAEVGALLDRLVACGAERIALVGGLAGRYRRALPLVQLARIVEPRGDALDGALRLARESAR